MEDNMQSRKAGINYASICSVEGDFLLKSHISYSHMLLKKEKKIGRIVEHGSKKLSL